MLHLTYSNQTEELLRALDEQLEAERRRPGRSPLEPALLVVPNGNVETYLKLGLAQARGIAANLEVRYLRRFVAELVERSRPEVRLLDASALEGFVLALLHDEKLLAEDALADVRGYLHGAGDEPDGVDLRRVQLAHQLAVLFDEYALSRAEMLEGWLRGHLLMKGEGGPLASIERWQRRLWLALAGPGGLVERREKEMGTRWRTLGRAFFELGPAGLVVPPHVHVFGLSHVARVFQQVLATLARATELYMYTVNPCMEYWEDVPSGTLDVARFPRREGDRGAIDLEGNADPFGLESASSDPAALRLWGRPGRENVRLLNELSECDFTPRFADPTASGRTLLGDLQREILLRTSEPAAPDETAPVDESVRIFQCPGVRREAEVVAAEIWRLVHADPSLRFNEIAVIVPGARKEQYQTHLPAVFRELHQLPHAVVDLPLSAESRVVEAVALLLELPLGGFGRQDLLRLITHPAVLARHPHVEASEWIGFCEALGVVHGADRTDHAGTYIAHDLFNWDQGIRRLALGAFLSGRGTGAVADAPLFSVGDELYVPEECPQDLQPSAAAFGLLVRSLIADARFARSARRTLREWVTFLRGLVGQMIGADTDEDQRALGKCHDALDALADLDVDGRTLSYRVACELAKSRLSGLTASRGQYLADGVVIASFLPMRAIPFKVVFVVGLGEGQFPSGDRVSHLDLRQARRRPGDVSAREQDKYLFLETLLCARQRLYLSYVSREPLTGDELAPSSVVVELQQILERHRSREALAQHAHRTFRLRRDEDEHTRWASLAAEGERRARRLGEALREHLGRPALTLEEVRAATGSSFTALREPLGLCPPPPPAPAPSGHEVLEIPITAVRKFLECPIQGAARYLLGMREEEDDDALQREDEIFATPKLHLMIGLREAFWRAVAADPTGRDPTGMARAYLAWAERAERLALVPTGVFGATERDGHLRLLAGWRARYDELCAGRTPEVSVLRFGRAEEHARVDRLLPPVVLPVELPGPNRVEVRLYGRTETRLRFADEAGSLLLLKAKLTGSKKEPAAVRDRKEALKAFLDYTVQLAAGEPLPLPYRAYLLNADGAGETALLPHRFLPLQATQARAWLGGVLADMLGGTHDYLLPCEAVFQHARDGERSLAEVIDDLREDGASSRFGPVRNAARFPAPDETRAAEMVARRFGPILASLERGGA